MRFAARCWALFLVLSAAVGSAVEAQSGRDALLQGHQAYDLAEFERAVQLLSLGLDPSAGPQDSLWSAGVHKLVDALLESGSGRLALTWARWASRLVPDLPLDSINFPPRITEALMSARNFAAANALPPTVRLSWRWPLQPPTSELGSLVADPGGTQITVVIEGGAILSPGTPVTLAAGTYNLLASGADYVPIRAAVEVLPGVVTAVRIVPEPVAEGFLYVASRPWGTVLVNGERIGYTTVAGYRLRAGTHRVRVERPGYLAFDTTVAVTERNQRIRLGNIQLRPERP